MIETGYYVRQELGRSEIVYCTPNSQAQMNDFRKQLAEIRPLIGDRQSLDVTNTEISEKPEAFGLREEVSGSSTPEDLMLRHCIERLPRHGRIESFDKHTDSGKIRGDGLRLQSSTRLRYDRTRGTRDLRNLYIVYAVGLTKPEGRKQVVQWALIDDIPWPNCKIPSSQTQLNNIRIKLLRPYNLESLIACLSADWYEGFEKRKQKSYLADDALKTVLYEAIHALPEGKCRFEKIREALQVSRYSFLNQWDLEAGEQAPEFLMRMLSAQQLVALGSPRHQWMVSVHQDTKPQLIEWALRAKLTQKKEEMWKEELNRDFTWDAKIASSLLKSDWQPTTLGLDWIQNLTRKGRIASSHIVRRMKANPGEASLWMGCLANDAKWEFLVNQYPSREDLIQYVSTKNDPSLELLALRSFSLAIDIEYNPDDENLWEIGTATWKTKSLLLSRHEEPGRLPDALKKLGQEIRRSKLLVGHNIVCWDWPILAPLLPESEQPILWDTLLVAFMLDPWKASHALGGTHHADQDAQDTLQLFESQLERIGEGIALRLLSGEINTTSMLMTALGQRLQLIDWTPPSRPADLVAKEASWRPSQVLVVNRQRIQRLAWVPKVAIVSADDQHSLSVEDLAIDEAGVNKALQARLDDDPFAIAVTSVLRMASSSNIIVRVSMLPLWLREKPQLDQAIRSAAVYKEAPRDWLAVAPYPTRAAWYAENCLKGCVFLDPPEALFVADVGWSRARDLQSSVEPSLLHMDNASQSGTQYRVRIGHDPSIDIWFSLDPAGQRLTESGRYFRTLKTIASLQSDTLSIVRTSSNLQAKPRLLLRDDKTLHPGTQDQANYWKDVIKGLSAIAGNQQPGSVGILLVGSSGSAELVALLNQCLCELSITLPHADHHSKRDRLRKAASIKGGRCLVDLVDTWPYWSALASESAISLYPIVEYLPVSDWFAIDPQETVNEAVPLVGMTDLDEPDNERDEIDTAEDDIENDGDDAPLKAPLLVSGADIAARTPELVKANLARWLHQTGMAECSQACVILDPRISPRHRDICQLFECLDWDRLAFSESERKTLDLLLEPLDVRREEAPSDYESIRVFLEKYWNVGKQPGDPTWITDFREDTQRPAIEAIRDRAADVLVTLPTGEGKSVLFQVPALCKGLRTRRLSIVISPLRALMRDQVQKLWQIGFHQSVDYLTADRPIHEIEDVYQGILDHRIVLLYVAPERFRSKRFIDNVNRRFDRDGAFEYVIVDEAHCVSQWGYEFRPDYFFALNSVCLKYRSADIAEKTPLLLLSATVTAANREHLSGLIRGKADISGDVYLPFKARPDQYFHPIRNHIEIRPEAVPGRINIRPKAGWPIAPRIDIIIDLVNKAQQNSRFTGVKSALIIFVTRRDHAEELSFLLGKEVTAAVDCFHAGLDSESRADVYQRFLDKSIDVLVATKAFGMGMDIPHIHWAIHLAPPTFLEDYLQEVGRIGRGESERKDARLDRLTATLLYSSEDFETNRSFIQRNRIELRQVSDFYGTIRENSKLSEEGVLVTMMPDAGFNRFDTAGKRRAGCVQARKILFWLERLGRVEILANMPGLLPVTLKFDQLGRIAETERGPLADVARLLHSVSQTQDAPEINELPAPGSPSREGRSVLDRIIDGLSNFVGMLFGQPRRPEPSNLAQQSSMGSTCQTREREGEAIINLGQIWRDTSLPHIDDVLSTVVELEERQALEVTRKIGFSRRKYSHASPLEIDLLFNSLKDVAMLIVEALQHESQYPIDFEKIAEGLPATEMAGELVDVRGDFERSVCYLLRVSGVRIRDHLKDGNRELVATLARQQTATVASRVEAAISASSALWREFVPLLQAKECAIEITKLLNSTRQHARNRRFRESELRRHLGILGALRLISVSEPLVPMSYVLSVHRSEEDLDESDHPEVWEELGKVNRLTELRGDALEIFVNLPVEARDQFIESYFKMSDPDDMESFLTEQLGQIDDPAAGRFIEEKREQLQAKAINKLLELYTIEPEEPNQWLAISHPFDRNLLVNAGPGSGKTSVLIARLAHLIRFQHIRPEEILVLAFNRAVVFEIRTRIRELFGKLGYGAYVRRLRVATFHSFATRHLGDLVMDSDDLNQDRSKLLHRFADRLENDAGFRSSVAGGLRTLLVDEFQDVDDDIYKIIRLLSISTGQQAGVMVIGDDDQDILGWLSTRNESSDAFFQRFIEDYSLIDQDTLTLSVNFRSGQEIVAHTQDFISNFFRSTGAPSPRLKASELRSASMATVSSYKRIDVETDGFDIALEHISIELEKGCASQSNAMAILCRTNAEVARAYKSLHPICPELVIQNKARYSISQMRHLGIWVDLMKVMAQDGNLPLSESIYEKVQNEYVKTNIPEVERPSPDDITPRQLWELCTREHSYPYLSHLIEFVESFDSDQVNRLLGKERKPLKPPVVSTIHKVKGLEFDEVFVMPSLTDFPMEIGKALRSAAAEEARLYYVAMTRAKSGLTYFFGPRERGWSGAQTFPGNRGSVKILEGKHDEVAPSWAWETNGKTSRGKSNPDANLKLSYIREWVRVGDKITVDHDGYSLMHTDIEGRTFIIGQLAEKKGPGRYNSDLTVSAVVRYPYNGKQYFKGETDISVEKNEWGLAVLVSGFL